MKRPLLKRLTMLLVLSFVVVAMGCKHPVVQPPPPPPPPPPPAPAPTITLNADRISIQTGQGVTLRWSTTNAATVTIQPGIGAVQPAATGTRQVNPTATTNYTATATGPGGTATSAALTITVTAPPPPQPPPPPADNGRVTTPPQGGNPTPQRPQTPVTPQPTLDQLFAQSMIPVLFDYDKSNIRPDQEGSLNGIATWLKQNPTVRFTIEGHADERGSQEYNIALGDARAASVKKYLGGQGVADTRMNTISFGEERPVCREANEDCWQRNRRGSFTRLP